MDLWIFCQGQRGAASGVFGVGTQTACCVPLNFVRGYKCPPRAPPRLPQGVKQVLLPDSYKLRDHADNDFIGASAALSTDDLRSAVKESIGVYKEHSETWRCVARLGYTSSRTHRRKLLSSSECARYGQRWDISICTSPPPLVLLFLLIQW